MKTWQVIAFSLFCGLLAAGMILLVVSPPRGQAVALPPLPTAAPLIIYITGAVKQPGVYSLPTGSRVKDAIESAQGLISSADSTAINLAAPLRDGEHLVIPEIGEALPTQPGSSATAQVSKTTASFSLENPLNINTASQSELELLPGIGPTRASAIIAYREANGPFKQIQDIQNVPGIGPSTFQNLKAIITIE
jgi:competence protein ComEA